MGRKILFVTTDQQRYDALGCTGGTVARTPVVDSLAADGIVYRRAHNQNTVCMPARSTMITGQYVRTHGVVSNGIPLPLDAPSIAGHLHGEGGIQDGADRKGPLPARVRPGAQVEGEPYGPRAVNRPVPRIRAPRARHARVPAPVALRQMAGGKRSTVVRRLLPADLDDQLGTERRRWGRHRGARGQAQPDTDRDMYHTDWVADRAIAWLDSLDPDDDWFCWMSFPDPHHPWDPPVDEVRRRIDWRDLDLPAGHPGSPEKVAKVLSGKPHHWLDWYEGRFNNMEGGPNKFVPCKMTDDQVREVTALVHVENELIDEALGPGARPHRTSVGGFLTQTSSSPPTTESFRGISGCSSKALTTSTR